MIPKRVYDNYIHFELHKLQVEMNFQKDPNEIELIRYVNTIGNVVLFIKDEYYGPKKYIVVFNCQAKAKLLLHSQENVCKDCLMTRPRCPLRLGRI